MTDCVVMCDNDSGWLERDALKSVYNKSKETIAETTENQKEENREILQHFDIVSEKDFPSGMFQSSKGPVFFLEDTLETFLEKNWSDWSSKLEVVRAEGYPGGKNPDSYLIAASRCETEPPELITELLSALSILE